VRALVRALTILAAKNAEMRSDCHGGCRRCLGGAARAQRGHQRASDGARAVAVLGGVQEGEE
jgi:hypothetical protein